MSATFIATLADGEAVLRFPYDERLRQLLRAIPGRRWDPEARAWCVPLDPERAEALRMLFATVRGGVQISERLERALQRRTAKRRDECVLDLARPDEAWWFSLSTTAAPDLVAELLAHPGARTLTAIGRALIPIDEPAARLVRGVLDRTSRLRLTEDASHALIELSNRKPQQRRETPLAHEVEMRRDRRGNAWILIAAEHGPLVRAVANELGISVLDGPASAVALAPLEQDAIQIAELLERVGAASVDPRVAGWLERATSWNGIVEVDGPRGAPVFLLLGDVNRLPRKLREQARSVAGGATVPLTLESWRLMDERLQRSVSRAAKRCVAALQDGRPAPPAVLELSAWHDDATFVLAPGHDAGVVDAFMALAGAARAQRRASGNWHEHQLLPAIRADPFCIPELDGFLAKHGAWIAPDALALLQELREEHARAAGLVALSSATDASLRVAGLGGELKPFQRAGVQYLLAQRRAFLSDEQGLGKTIEALATLEADGAYPAVVVCPASLKLNWMRELERWLPGRTAQLLAGTSADGQIPSADVTVVNYDIVAARLQALCDLSPRALVLDESHYCKNPTAKRTQAVHRLAEVVPHDGLVVALTGTPVMNRAPELISQLRILGRLGDFGSGAQFSKRFRGPDAHLRLHWHLRARCFARRLKADVLPQLPPKTRSVVPVELDNAAEYRLAETDLVAWLRSQPLDLRELDARVAAALRAERLVRLNALKLLAARGKLAAALAWIHDFLSSGERLVVFAHHREVQRAVRERFPSALHILGEDSHVARDASVRAFQAADAAGNQLVVCSTEVAGQGLTLTRSSNVAFLELDWTPAKHDQAEDRCHRIGQQDAVTAWYLLAADTVDETIATLLERKRAVIGAVTDGRDEDEATIVDGVVRELRGEPYRYLRAVA